MTKYIATDAKTFQEHGVKFKSGQVVDISPETAAEYNRVCPGILKEYVLETVSPPPAIVPPAPVEDLVIVEELGDHTDAGFKQENV